MRVKGLSKRNGIYHLRVTVPKNLRAIIGKREIHKSLATENSRAAIRQSLVLFDEVEKWFYDVKAGKANPDYSWSNVECIEALPVVKHSSPRLSELLDKYIAIISQSHNSSSSAIEARRGIELFITSTNDKEVAEINSQDCRNFIDLLRNLPAYHSSRQELKNKTISELIEIGTHGNVELLSDITAKKYSSSAKAYLSWLVDYNYIPSNPYPERVKFGKSRDSLNKRNPFSQQQLYKFFSSSIFSDYTGNSDVKAATRYWTPYLSLYTGCRPIELMQLQLKNVNQHQTGFWYIDINTEGIVSDGKIEIRKTTKTAHSARKIPLHPDLIKLGFAEYIKSLKAKYHENERLLQGFTFLMSEKNGSKDLTKNMTRWYNRYMANIGVCEPKTGCSYYSFRHNFRDALSSAEIQDI